MEYSNTTATTFPRGRRSDSPSDQAREAGDQAREAGDQAREAGVQAREVRVWALDDSMLGAWGIPAT